MREHKDEEMDDLVDPDWEPSPEDFLPDEKTEEEKNEPNKPRNRWVKIISLVIAVALFFQVAAVLFSTFSLDALRFLRISYQLSEQKEIQQYKQAVVTVQGERSRGTGFAITKEGLIVTNHHVIDGQTNIFVGFHSGGLFQADIVSSYPENDLAFLKVDADDLPFLPLSDHSGEIGEEIYVIGNPLSWTQIANVGNIVDTSDVTIISAPIYRGNSGSPVINKKGEVVAVVFAKRRTSVYGGKSVGLAVPIEVVLEHIPTE